jgi:ribosomal peptide maturation radical SAM protein 1
MSLGLGNERKIIQKVSQKKGIQVLLIYMPMSELWLPSLGLSLLKSALSPLNLSAKILYFNLQFAKLTGSVSYQEILEYSKRLNQIGEWIFSGALFEQSKQDVENYIEKILRKPPESQRLFFRPVPNKFIQTVLKARGKVDRFLNECLHEVLSYHPRIVGFSSLYQQQVASLALAKRIKQYSPDTCIVFGGPNCEDIMGVETVRQFSFIDAVVSGEGDIVFPQLIQRVLEDQPLSDLQGVYTQTGHHPASNNGHYPNAPFVSDMDALPYPDYDDFFSQIKKSPIHLPQPQIIPMETSRGCWWGEKRHCTFCGLNNANINYRGKSSRRALDELTYLSQRYHGKAFRMSDNALNVDYFKNFIPELEAMNLGFDILYSVRPNLIKSQLRALSSAGMRAINPGIESLSSHVLKLMHKGVTQLQNVQLLKWCKEFGIVPIWNLFGGFPNEPPEDYHRMAHLIPLLAHFQPPLNIGHLSLMRFSPHYKDPEKFGFIDINPSPAYNYIYPIKPKAIANLAYFFIYGYRSPQNVEKYMKSTHNEYNSWKKSHELSDLFFVDEGKHLFIWDQRPIASKPLTRLSGIQRILYIACDGVQSIFKLKKIAENYTGKKRTQVEVEKILSPILESQLMIKDGHSYLSLAIPVGDYKPKKEDFEKFGKYLQAMEMSKQDKSLMERTKAIELLRDIKISKEEIHGALEIKGGIILDSLEIERRRKSGLIRV